MRTLLALAALLPALAQEKPRLGTPPADGETFAVELTLKTKAVEKEQVVFEYESSLTLAYSAAATRDGLRLRAKIRKFSFSSSGEKKVSVAWDESKKIEETDWTSLEALRDMVKDGFALSLDAAGNASACTSDNARFLVMTLEPILAGSATALPGDARAVGQTWETKSSNDQSEATWSNTYEKDEDGCAVIASTVSVQDRKDKDAGAGKGSGSTRVDLKTGRPAKASLTLEMSGSQTVRFEASARVVPAK